MSNHCNGKRKPVMPELPEVETTKNKIKPILIGQEITKIIAYVNKLRFPITEELTSLAGENVIDVYRRAKYIIIKLEKGYLVIHLGMTGFIKVVTEGEPRTKHDQIDLVLNNQTVLRYNDVRKFGHWEWVEKLEENPRLRTIGVEPLSVDFNSAYLLQQSTKRNVPIKVLIMDQKVVAGIGNIYANEALFRSKIHPLQSSNTLSIIQSAKLVEMIKEVLTRAVAQGGTTISDFKQPDGKLGYFFQELQVYDKKDQPCVICGRPIKKIMIAQRSSFYCDHCQKKDK